MKACTVSYFYGLLAIQSEIAKLLKKSERKVNKWSKVDFRNQTKKWMAVFSFKNVLLKKL